MTSNSDEQPLYRDASQPIEARVEDLLAHMTLEEKVAQLGSTWVQILFAGAKPRTHGGFAMPEEDFDSVEELQEFITQAMEEQAAAMADQIVEPIFGEKEASRLLQNGIGHITRAAGSSGGTPQQVAELNNAIQRFLREKTRLGIPATVHEESCAGLAARGATVFPQIIGVASTWDPTLAERMTRVIRRQMQTIGSHHTLAPVLDVVRDPRWGRVEETFGEDPYLVAKMGGAYIKGLQGGELEGIVCTGKHYAGYGVPEGGFNWAPGHINEREMRETFMFPFEAVIREIGLASIMNAYHEIDGVPCGASKELLTEILRDRWGFEGVVVSDYMTVATLLNYHHIVASRSEAAIVALEAGLDLELPNTDCYGEPLLEALAEGRIDEAVIDRSVRRVLRQKFIQGLFEDPYVDPDAADEQFDTLSDRALAREIATRSMVLIKNEGKLLPLDKKVASIALVGPNAHSLRNLNGDYHYPAHNRPRTSDERRMRELGKEADPMEVEELLYQERYTPFVSVYRGIEKAVGADTELLYAQGCDVMGKDTSGIAEAVEAARQAEVAVIVVGGKSGLSIDCTSGEFRDRATLGLPGVQRQLVEAVVATGTPTVAVLINGRPLALTWLSDKVDAILEAWLPGEEGGNAVADVLFGDVNPAGRLTMSFPRGVGQVPTFYNHKPSGGRSQMLGAYVEMSNKPLYPFGYGLSYTTFEYSDLEVTPEETSPTGEVTISFTVTNSGDRAGDEVVQLYLHDEVSSVTQPVQVLKGFRRIPLEPGESARVSFTVSMAQLAFYDVEMDYVVEPGEIEVMVGASSADIRLEGSFQIAGEKTVIDKKVFFSRCTVE